MPKLYLRIYLAVLASLAAFALASGFLWRQLGDAGPAGHAFEVAGTLAQNVLPPAGAPTSEQQAALYKLAANLRADVALFAADRTRLAAVGDSLPAPDTGRDRGGWLPPGLARLPVRSICRTAAGWSRACRTTAGIWASACSSCSR